MVEAVDTAAGGITAAGAVGAVAAPRSFRSDPVATFGGGRRLSRPGQDVSARVL